MTSGNPKVLWVQTTSKAVFTAAVEAGIEHFVFDAAGEHLAAEWSKLASIPHTLIVEAGDGDAARISEQHGGDKRLAALMLRVGSRADVDAVAKLAADPSLPAVVMDAADWQSIPAENLVAAFQGSPVKLMATAAGSDDARMKLEALETGVSGVLLRTDSPAQVRELAAYVRRHAEQGAQRLQYEVATVTRLQAVGMGDRVCVDLCSNMVAGEGMLVGSFARGLFLVHSECADSAYINSRPFRVNAGPVHAYTSGDGGKTAYLAELATGQTVAVANAAGGTRTSVVGRVKVEKRPLVLVEATADDGGVYSTLLQNAETVRLVGPADATASATTARTQLSSEAQEWQATSVSQLREGTSRVFILKQAAARHTGVAIEENIQER